MPKGSWSFMVRELRYISRNWCKVNLISRNWCKVNVVFCFGKLYTNYNTKALLFLVVE